MQQMADDPLAALGRTAADLAARYGYLFDRRPRAGIIRSAGDLADELNRRRKVGGAQLTLNLDTPTQGDAPWTP